MTSPKLHYFFTDKKNLVCNKVLILIFAWVEISLYMCANLLGEILNKIINISNINKE